MDRTTFESKRKSIETPSRRGSYVEYGEGPVALFVHGVLVNSYQWRHQVAGLIVWGTDDNHFDVKWAHWLAETIPGTRRWAEFEGARLFFPEERWSAFNDERRAHWAIA